MANQNKTKDNGRDIVIRKSRDAKVNQMRGKVVTACYALGITYLFLLFFGGGGATLFGNLSGVASGKTQVRVNGGPIGSTGGVILFGFLIAFLILGGLAIVFNLLSELFKNRQGNQKAIQKNCVINSEGIRLHDERDFEYLLSWEGIQSFVFIQDTDGQKYVGVNLKDQSYTAACRYTNTLINKKHSARFPIIFSESSLPLPAVDFIKLLLNRAKAKGQHIAAEKIQDSSKAQLLISDEYKNIDRQYEEVKRWIKILIRIFVYPALILLAVMALFRYFYG